MGSSCTRAWTHVPCIGWHILNHCATREVPIYSTFKFFFPGFLTTMNHTIYSTLGSLPFLGATEFPSFPSSLQTILKPMTLSAWLELWAAMKLQRISDPMTSAIQNELLLPSSESFNWKVLRPWIIHVVSRTLHVVLVLFCLCVNEWPKPEDWFWLPGDCLEAPCNRRTPSIEPLLFNTLQSMAPKNTYNKTQSPYVPLFDFAKPTSLLPH